MLVCAGSASGQAPAPAAGTTVVTTPPAAPRGYTGFTIRFSMMMTPGRAITREYPVIGAVHRGSPAQKAGLAPGDVILEIDGRDAREEGALRVLPGVRYALRIRRGDAEREVALVAVPRPAGANGLRL